MAQNRREIELVVAAETTGGDGVRTLAEQIEQLAEQGGEAAPQFQRLAEELRKIEGQQGLISNFTKLKAETGEAARALEDAQRKAQALGREFAATENPSRKLTSEFSRAKREVGQAKEALQQKQRALQGVRGEMTQAGIGTKNLAQTQAQLRTAASGTAAEFLRVQQAAQQNRQGLVDYGASAAQAGKSVQQLGNESASLGERLNSVKGEVLAAAAALSAVTLIIGNAAKESAQFGKSMAEVSTLLDDTSGMDELTASVRALSREFGGNVNDNAKALYDIISAGAADAAQATEILTAANKLAVGGVTDVKTAADGLTSILNAYGEAAGGAGNVSDALFTAMRGGKTTINELSNSLGQVAPLAATAGVGLEELLAATAAITTGGVKTSVAVTQLRGALTNIIKPSGDAAKLAKQLGIDFSAAAVQSQGLAGFLEQVRIKTGGSTDAMAKLFGGVEGLSAVLALTGNQAEKFGGILDEMGGKAGATEEAVGKMMDTPAARSKRFEAALNDVRLSLGDAVTAFSPLIEAVTSTLNLFNDAPGPMKATVAGLGAVAVAIPAVNLAVRNLSAAWATLAGTSAAAAPATAAAARAAAASGVASAAAVPAVNALAAAKARLAAASRAVIASTGPVGLALTALGAGAVYLTSKYNDARLAALDAELAVAESFAQPDDRVSPALETVATTAEAARFKLAGVQQQFMDLTREGATTADALGKIVEKADFGSVDGVAKLVSDLQLLRDSAFITGEQIQTAITDRLVKLSGQDLNDFGIQAEMAFGRGEISAEQLAVTLEARAAAAARKLGVDIVWAADQLSDEFREAKGSLDVLLDSFDLLEEQGKAAGEILEAAILKTLDAASSPVELEHIGKVIRDAGEAGRLSEQQIVAMLDAVRTKADQTTPGINSVAEALKALGVVSDAALRQTADRFHEAYAAVVRMGGSVREQQAAFSAYARAAIAANDGVVDATLRTKAAQHGLQIETGTTGQAVVRNMAEARDATDALGKAATDARDRVTEIGSAAEGAASGFAKLSQAAEPGKGAGATGGGAFSSPFQAAYARAEQVGGLALRKELEAMYQELGRGGLGLTASSGVRRMGEILQRLNERVDQEQLTKESVGRVGTGRADPAARSEQVHRVEIAIGDQRRSVGVASGEDARALIEALQELQRRAA